MGNIQLRHNFDVQAVQGLTILRNYGACLGQRRSPPIWGARNPGIMSSGHLGDIVKAQLSTQLPQDRWRQDVS